jgi:DNA invertase Pin-like site-specific DNA recombinase
MEVVGYARVSTQEQADSGAGLEAQRAAIEMEASRRGWRLVSIHEDAGASGKSMDGRPGLQHALAAVEGDEASGLVVAKLDRLSRSLLDFAALMERARRNHWSLVALDLGVDTSTPAGEMMAAVLATFAQFERRIIGQRTKDALAIKRAQGVQLGRPRAISTDTVERIRLLRAEGLTLAGVAQKLNREAVPTPTGEGRWHPAGISRALALGTAPRDRFDRDASGACDA